MRRNDESPTMAVVMAVYWLLPDRERQAVDEVAQQLVDRFHSQPGSPKGIGLESAVRLIGCLGVLLIKWDDWKT